MFALRQAYAWTVLLPGAITSLVTTWYLFTNHGLHDIGDGSDVLGATTSVVVPKFCDVLHSNFSYHAEHHLFPTINPHYYPLVREMFQNHYPAEYHRLSMREAWRRLRQNKIIAVRRSVARATGQTLPQTDPLP